MIRERDAGDPVLWGRLANINAPTLLIGGGPKSHIPRDKLDKVAQVIPRCRLLTIAAGHKVHATRPSQFADTVLNWITNT